MRAFQAVPCRTVVCRMWKFAVLTLVTCAISDTHTARYNMSGWDEGPKLSRRQGSQSLIYVRTFSWSSSLVPSIDRSAFPRGFLTPARLAPSPFCRFTIPLHLYQSVGRGPIMHKYVVTDRNLARHKPSAVEIHPGDNPPQHNERQVV